MLLPNTARAIIAPEKIHRYLLSSRHPLGRHKAAFFQSLGYSRDKWEALADDLRKFLVFEANETQASRYGRKFEIRGALHGPNGASADVVTIWMLRYREDFPRFVTAYPEKRS